MKENDVTRDADKDPNHEACQELGETSGLQRR
jgi:hypothetical protein